MRAERRIMIFKNLCIFFKVVWDINQEQDYGKNNDVAGRVTRQE